MNIENLHADYIQIRNMRSSRRIKKMMLQALVSEWTGIWRVVGVTMEALHVFREHSFKRVSRMGINRSHLVPRSATFDQMLATEMLAEEWWEFFVDRDKTILATSSQNSSNRTSEFAPIDDETLFRSKGFAWTHGDAEEQKLRELYAQYCSS